MRKITKEVLDIAKNAVFVGGVKYLADKSGSKVLWWAYAALWLVLFLYVNSYIQGPAVAGVLSRKWKLGRLSSKMVGWALTAVVLFAMVVVIDQTVSSIAGAMQDFR